MIEFAISKAGHDKDHLYFIIERTDAEVMVADGVLKTYEAPKKKNPKHIQVIKNIPQNIVDEFEASKLPMNDKIKRALKLYRKEA